MCRVKLEIINWLGIGLTGAIRHTLQLEDHDREHIYDLVRVRALTPTKSQIMEHLCILAFCPNRAQHIFTHRTTYDIYTAA